MRLPISAHEAHDWVIDDIAPDFTLLDVWALPVYGSRGDFDAFLEMMAGMDPVHSGSALSRVLFELRLRVGGWLGWDDARKIRPIPGCSETTLAARLPTQLRDSASRPAIGVALLRAAGGFQPLYRTDDEWAAELSNATVHGVMHLTWVPQGVDRCQGRLAVYVKSRGPLGAAYLKLIEPFRHHIVYPALTREIERAWNGRSVVAMPRN